MHPNPQPEPRGAEELETAVDQAIAACGGDARDAIRALIVANDFLEFEVGDEGRLTRLRSRKISDLFRLGAGYERSDLLRCATFCSRRYGIAAGEPTECFNPNAAVMRPRRYPGRKVMSVPSPSAAPAILPRALSATLR
jgi:hypothetical protein